MTHSDLSNLIASGFEYTIELFAPDGRLIDSETRHNLMPRQGLSHIADVVFKKAPQAQGWYLAPFEGDYQPLPTDTASIIAASSTEITAYSATTRPEFVAGAITDGALNNSANRAEFTFTADKTVRGAFLVSSSPKAGTTGVLMSVVRFATPKVCENGSVLRLTAGVGFTSV